jgi:hypothetical protein
MAVKKSDERDGMRDSDEDEWRVTKKLNVMDNSCI